MELPPLICQDLVVNDPGGIGTESPPVAGFHWAAPSTALDKAHVTFIIRLNKKIIPK